MTNLPPTVGSEIGFTLEHSLILCSAHIHNTLVLLWLEVFNIPALPNSPALWGPHVKSGLLPEDWRIFHRQSNFGS